VAGSSLLGFGPNWRIRPDAAILAPWTRERDMPNNRKSYRCLRCGSDTEHPLHVANRCCVICGALGAELDRVENPHGQQFPPEWEEPAPGESGEHQIRLPAAI
jgi:ribosomal protein L37E